MEAHHSHFVGQVLFNWKQESSIQTAEVVFKSISLVNFIGLNRTTVNHTNVGLTTEDSHQNTDKLNPLSRLVIVFKMLFTISHWHTSFISVQPNTFKFHHQYLDQ